MLQKDVPGEISPMEKVVGVRTDAEVKGYTYSITREKKVLQDTVGGEPIVIFHLEGMASALDNRASHRSRDDCSTGVFSSIINGINLQFEYSNSAIRDKNTGSIWNISGRAVSGPLKGEQLEIKIYGDYFAFAWLVFYPETGMYE